MDPFDELKEFAKEKENETRAKLDVIKNNIERKITTCVGIRSQFNVIEADPEYNNQDQVDDAFCSNLDGILQFYNKQLKNIEASIYKMNDILLFDFSDVQLNERNTLTYYKNEITRNYDDVIVKFNQTSGAIIRFCKVLLDIADQNRTEKLGKLGSAYVMVNILVNFIIPIKEIGESLKQALEFVEERDRIVNANNDDNKQIACSNLKKCASEIIKEDNKIKGELSKLLDAIVDGCDLNDAFKKDFFDYLEQYYGLNSFNMIHFQLCSFKFERENQASSDQIREYYEKITDLKKRVQSTFDMVLKGISDALREPQGQQCIVHELGKTVKKLQF